MTNVLFVENNMKTRHTMRRQQSTSSDGVVHIDKSCSSFNDETTALLLYPSLMSPDHSLVSVNNSSPVFTDSSDDYSSCSSSFSNFYTKLSSDDQSRDESGDGNGENENSAENDSAKCSPFVVTNVGCNRTTELGGGTGVLSSLSSSQTKRGVTERPQILNVTSTNTIARQQQQQLTPKCNQQRICTTRAIPSILKRTLSEGVKVQPVPLSTLQRRHQQIQRQQEQPESELCVCPVHQTVNTPQQLSGKSCQLQTRHSILKHNLANNKAETTVTSSCFSGLRKTANISK